MPSLTRPSRQNDLEPSVEVESPKFEVLSGKIDHLQTKVDALTNQQERILQNLSHLTTQLATRSTPLEKEKRNNIFVPGGMGSESFNWTASNKPGFFEYSKQNSGSGLFNGMSGHKNGGFDSSKQNSGSELFKGTSGGMTGLFDSSKQGNSSGLFNGNSGSNVKTHEGTSSRDATLPSNDCKPSLQAATNNVSSGTDNRATSSTPIFSFGPKETTDQRWRQQSSSVRHRSEAPLPTMRGDNTKQMKLCTTNTGRNTSNLPAKYPFDQSQAYRPPLFNNNDPGNGFTMRRCDYNSPPVYQSLHKGQGSTSTSQPLANGLHTVKKRGQCASKYQATVEDDPEG